jgi:hypothetical protein
MMIPMTGTIPGLPAHCPADKAIMAARAKGIVL